MFALGLALLLPHVVDAHARFARSEPGADSFVSTPPDQVRVWFTEEVATRGSSLEVVDSSGARVDRGDGHVDLNDPGRRLMVVSLQSITDGRYTVRWRTVSAVDGHAADGTFLIVVQIPTPVPSPSPTPSGPAPAEANP
jgi:methionine-rich copper-binding protein CopC